MRHFFGWLIVAGLLLVPASRADAQVAVSVGYPAYGYGYGVGYPSYVYPRAYAYPRYFYPSAPVGAYGGYGVNIAVPGFSYSSGYGGFAPPVTPYYAPSYYTPSVRVNTPFFSYYGFGAPVVRYPY